MTATAVDALARGFDASELLRAHHEARVASEQRLREETVDALLGMARTAGAVHEHELHALRTWLLAEPTAATRAVAALMLIHRPKQHEEEH